MKVTTKLWLGILILAVLSPLGLMLPEYFKAGEPFGEEKIVTFWKASFPEYLSHSRLFYIASAIVGILAVVITMLVIGKRLTRKGS